MNRLSTFIALLTLTSSLVHAQDRAGSGSGNGTLNREVLRYETQLRESQLDISSMSEAFEKIKVEMRKLSNMAIPVTQVNEDAFWTTLHSDDQKILQTVDKKLVNNIVNQIIKIDEVKKDIIEGQKLIDFMKRRSAHYESLNQGKEFKQLLDNRRESLKDRMKEQLKGILSNLERPIRPENSYDPSCGYQGDDFSDCTYVDAMAQCRSGLCMDLLLKKYDSYINAVAKIGQLEIKILGINTSLSNLTHETKKYDSIFKHLKKMLNQSYFMHLDRAVNWNVTIKG